MWEEITNCCDSFFFCKKRKKDSRQFEEINEENIELDSPNASKEYNFDEVEKEIDLGDFS